MLDEKSRELLLGARERIASEKQQFICTALSEEAEHLDGEAEDAILYTQSAGNLRKCIEGAIAPCYVFDIWLFSETGYYPESLSKGMMENWEEVAYNGWNPVSRKQFLDWCHLARLAWIDRILETGEIG